MPSPLRPFGERPGTLGFLLGSLVWLIAQLSVARPWWSDDDEGYNDNDSFNSYNIGTQATATTSLVLSLMVLILAVVTLVFHGRTPNGQAASRIEQQWIQQTNLLHARRTTLLLAPSLALFVVLAVRLFGGASNFHGVPYYLDFGWKYGLLPHDRSVEADGDALYNEPAEKSVAFLVEFNSYGHALQGFLAALLTAPVVVARSTERGKNVLALLPWVLTLYPTYSLVKRLAKARQAFAGSSFSNNAGEWAAGFLVGWALGDFLTALALWRSGKDPDEDAYERQPDAATSQVPPWWKVWENPNTNDEDTTTTTTTTTTTGTEGEPLARWAQMLQTALGVLLFLTVMTGSLLMGTTWHGCLPGSPDECVNASGEDAAASIPMVILFVGLPLIIVGGSALVVRRRATAATK